MVRGNHQKGLEVVPFKVTGRSGSTRITLMPAPAGKGLVIGDYGRRVLTDWNY